MPVSEATYERVALEADDEQWEWHCGRLRKKPDMTLPHNDIGFELAFAIRSQLSADEFAVRSNAGRAARPGTSHFIPDVMVIPRSLTRRQMEASGALEEYPEPLPFVAEVWSRSTGDYDVDTKIPEYRARGDAVIWRLHPYERTVTAWVHQRDGSYTETVHRGGTLSIPSLPGVTVDLDELFRTRG